MNPARQAGDYYAGCARRRRRRNYSELRSHFHSSSEPPAGRQLVTSPERQRRVVRAVPDRQALCDGHAESAEDLRERFGLFEHLPQRLLLARRRVGEALVVLVVAVA